MLALGRIHRVLLVTGIGAVLLSALATALPGPHPTDPPTNIVPSKLPTIPLPISPGPDGWGGDVPQAISDAERQAGLGDGSAVPAPPEPSGKDPVPTPAPSDDPPASDNPPSPSPPDQVPRALDSLQGTTGTTQQQAAQAGAQAGAAAQPLLGDPLGYTLDTAQRTAGDAPALPSPADLLSAPDPTGMGPASQGAAVEAGNGLIPPILAGSILVAGAAGATFIAFWLAGSSGTVSVGSAAAASRNTELRRLLPFASPLFTRFEKDTVLGHPRREALYALVIQQPGVSLQALGEATGLSRTAVLHHLRLLELQHLVVSKRMGRSRHYYENGGRYGRDAKEAYAILQNSRSKQVAEFIRTHPGAMQKQLCESLGIQPSIAHWHVRRLQAAQLVDVVRQGRAVNYFPAQSLQAVAAVPSIPAAVLAAPTPAPV